MHAEHLTGGLVTSRDPSFLESGELQEADDVHLRPNDPSLHLVPSRRSFGSLSADGLAYCGFDNASDRIAAVSGGNYYVAPAAETGTFAQVGTGAGTTLAAISIDNRVALVSGGTNKVLLPDGTLRPMGLAPITSPAVLTYNAAAGAAGLFASTLLGNGWFQYWTVEVYKVGTEDVEGTFIGTPNQVHVTVDTATVTITRPTIVNSAATHWRVYRSDTRTSSTDAGFPNGFLVATVAIATGSYVDGTTTTTAATFPATAVDAPTFGLAGFVYAGAWANVTNVLADDAATAISPALTGNMNSAIKVGTFGLANITDPITDISVTVEAATGSADVYLNVYLSPDGGNNTTAGQTYPLTNVLTDHVANGLWARTWTASEVMGSNLVVYLLALGLGGAGSITIDKVTVAITYGLGSDLSVVFPSIVITEGPVVASIGKNGLPPNATTGDVFQGSVIGNDVANPRQTWYTVPGTIDYSPAIYRLPWTWPVQHIATLDSVCIVGQTGRVDRLNFLPLESDSEFNVGRAVSPVDENDGIVGYNAACKFMVGGQLRLFYVGYTGLRMTNGFGSETATDDIAWATMTDQSKLNRCHVVNNAKYQEILVFFPVVNDGGIKCVRLSYNAHHLKNGKLKVTGITNFGPVASTYGINDSNERVVYTSSGGTVYIENRGVSETGHIKTREMYLAGLGGSWEMTCLAVHHSQYNGTIQFGFETTQANYPNQVIPGHSFVPAARQLSIVDGAVAGEGIAVTLDISGEGELDLNYIAFPVRPLGETYTITT